MMKSHLLGAVGIVVVVSSIAGVLAAQTPASPASNGARLASLPDNPCDLLTREQVASSTGLEITAMRREPDIHSLSEAQSAGREPQPGIICLYETRSKFGALTVIVPASADRTSVSYRQAHERAFAPPSLAQPIPGLGEDAWGDGSHVSVFTRQGETFTVAEQMSNGRSVAPQLIALARAVMDHLQ